MKRRRLLASAALGGALVVGWGFLPPRSRLGGRETMGNAGEAIGLNGWIRVAPDGSVQLAMPKAEMGQGVHTALAMLVAEELELPLERVQPVDAGADTLYGNVPASVESLLFFEPVDSEPGHETRLVRGTRWLLAKVVRELGVVVTGGSSSVADLWPVLPLAAATARAQLLGAASLRWKLPMAELQLADGVISHPSGPKAHFGELARAAAATPAAEVRIKPRDEWKRIGRPVPRTDLPAKVNGSAVFGIDVRQPGQLFAVVRMSPALHGAPGTAAVDAVLQRPGVLRVVRVPPLAGAPAALAVVGRSTWHAMEGARALEVDWLPAPGRAPDSKDIAKALAEAARAARDEGEGFAFRRRGDAASVRGARRLEAAYRAPYLAHATMEPMNCTARIAADRAEVWVPTQNAEAAHAALAESSGLPLAQCAVHRLDLGGGFGRRGGQQDYVRQAVAIARQFPGTPVQLIWSREEDQAQDTYRPISKARLSAGLDAAGNLTALHVRVSGQSINAFVAPMNVADGKDRRQLQGFWAEPGDAQLGYSVPNLRVEYAMRNTHVPVGPWRGVNTNQNGVYMECFIDEVARAANVDALEFRRRLMGKHPKHLAVLNAAATKAGWGTPLPPGLHRGIAQFMGYGSYSAAVAEVSVSRDGELKVHRMVLALDCGHAVNPEQIAAQVEGSVAYGLSAALYGEISIDKGRAVELNFDRYPILKLAAMPRVETVIVPSGDFWGGVGEPTICVVTPSVLNAIHAATGKPVRSLPLRHLKLV